MNTMTEDILMQQTTADYLQKHLQWNESVYAMDETLGKEGTLGRDSKNDADMLLRHNAKVILPGYRLRSTLQNCSYCKPLELINPANDSQGKTCKWPSIQTRKLQLLPTRKAHTNQQLSEIV